PVERFKDRSAGFHGTSLEKDELIIAGVTKVIVEPDPRPRVEECLGRQCPALKIEQFLLIAITLDHEVLVFANALDFANGGLQLEHFQVVQTTKRNDEVKMLIGPLITLLRAVTEQCTFEIRVLRRQAVFGNIKADQLQPRLDQLHFIQKKRLAAADIQNART